MQNKDDSGFDSGMNWTFWYSVIIITNLVFITIIYQYFTQFS